MKSPLYQVFNFKAFAVIIFYIYMFDLIVKFSIIVEENSE